MQKKILFIDDEPNILQGYRRTLHPMRNIWKLEFAQSGTEALEKLKESKFDAVISDMRMPGMDGTELLEEVSKTYPDTLRIILSGTADEQLILKSLTPTHRFLTKPIDPSELKLILERALFLQDTLENQDLKNLISKISRIPSQPSLYTKLIKELKSPDFSIKKIVQIVSQDVSMTAKILKIINSSYFGLRREIKTLDQAITYLGINTLKAIVFSVEVFSKFDEKKIQELDIVSVFNHSQKVGSFGKVILDEINPIRNIVNEVVLCGVMHDIGKIILADNLPDLYSQIKNVMRDHTINYLEAEKIIFKATHADVGAYLLGLWGLSDQLINTTKYHHSPSLSQNNEFDSLAAVHIANVIVNHTDNTPIKGEEFDLEYLERLGVQNKIDHLTRLYKNV
jgi:HD-like signal output (HDOD) protein